MIHQFYVIFAEIYEKEVSNCSVKCSRGTRAVQQLRCYTKNNDTSCDHIGLELRDCYVRDESCPGKSDSFDIRSSYRQKTTIMNLFQLYYSSFSNLIARTFSQGTTNTEFTEWTSWSSCSRTCINDYENIPYKRRSRTCHPYCNKAIGTEEEACVDLPMCKNGKKSIGIWFRKYTQNL